MTRRESTQVFLTLLSIAVAIFLSIPGVILGADREPRPERADRDGRIAGQYIIVLKDSVSNADAAENDLVGGGKGERLDSYRSAIRGFSAKLSDDQRAAIANDPRVAFVSEDREVSILDSQAVNSVRAQGGDMRTLYARPPRNAPPPPPPSPSPSPTPTPPPSSPPASDSPSSQALGGQLQTLPTGINRIDAEGKSNKGAGINVAIIDTGIQLSHPDLKDNIVGGKNCSSGSSYNDGNGHGTHVAGTIAAEDNGFGVVGVAPAAKLWAVRVLNNSGAGSWSSVICGIDFVTSKAPQNGGPITVANLSLGGGGVSDNNCGNWNNDPLHKAICRARDAGVTFVVAAGNSGANAAGFVPAAYDDAVITVSALVDTNGISGGGGPSTSYGADDTFASFSNWGRPVDIGAPGVSIYSTWIGSSYKTISGTSMASPHVAGAAALYLSTHPGALWSDVRNALIAVGEPQGAGHTDPSGNHPEPVLNVSTF